MEPSSSEGAAPPSTEPKKTAWGKIAAVVIALIIIVGGVAVYLAFQRPTPPPTNNPPTISTVTADKGAADIGQQVSFTATATDSDGDPLTYTWNFGDNSTGTGGALTHSYQNAGNYITIVTVSDGRGGVVASESRPVFVLVNQAARPQPARTEPTATPSPVAIISADRSIIQVNGSILFRGNSSWTWAWDAAITVDTDGDDIPDAPTGWVFNDAATNATAVPTLSYNFGDGSSPATGTPSQVGQVSHQFTTAGSHFVRLSVTNYLGESDIVGYTVRVTAATPPSGVVKSPDIFTEVTFGEPDSLDPAYDYETSGGQVIQNTVETLIWYRDENADVFDPMLATKVPDIANPADVSPDGLTWNFTLKSGVVFHSGNPVNCAAVEFSIERVLVLNDPVGPAWILDQSLTDYAVDDPGTPGVDERLVTIQDSVTCPAGATGLQVQFHLAKPYPAFLATLAFTAAGVIDPATSSYRVTGRCASANLMANYCHDQVIGTGPFKLRAWQPNQQIILDRNDNYHRAVAPFREVHIIKANDVATRVLMLKAGDADTIELPPNHKDDIRASPGGAVLPGIVEYSGDTFVVQFLGFNQAINVAAAPAGDVDVPADFFTDVNIRKAFNFAWDYDTFIQNVLYGYGSRLCGPIPSGMFGFDPTVPCYNRDLTQVQAYLEQALDPRTPDPADTYWDNGFTVTIYYNIGNLVREEGARTLQTTFNAINTNMRPGLPAISVRAQGLEWASFLAAVRDKTPALFFLGWAPDYADPDDYVVPFLRTGQFFPNRVGYSNTTLDLDIDAQSSELNTAARLQLLASIQRAPYYDVPYIWLYQSQAYNVFRSWVTGYYSNEMTTAGTGNYYYDLDK